jgi:ring-1,2-phenylacetyl-CoA epoxidase subunit PaaC
LSEATGGLAAFVLAMADDELVLSHRDSEWTGHAPILEEDIAFTNIALDEMGHSAVWYAICAGIEGAEADAYSDRMVFQRPAADFRCAPLVELPNGDWAFSMLRQYLFDMAEKVRLEALVSSEYAPLAQAAAKLRPEEAYHQRHTQAWVIRLGHGTPESNRRMQVALEALWGYAVGLFEDDPGTAGAVEARLVPETGGLRRQWRAEVSHALHDAGLAVPEGAPLPNTGRKLHTEHLESLLNELQSVARADPTAVW